MSKPSLTINRQSWLLLIVLSVLWGGSFFFVAIALRELPPMTLALARVAFAAAFIYPLFKMQGVSLPATIAGWKPFIVMGLFNNVIPFSLIFAGQARIASGLASVLNATTPLFALLVLASFGEEKLILRRVIGVLVGLAGVFVLRDPDLAPSEGQTVGMLLCLGGALSYGFAGLWGRRNFNNVPPLTTTTCQLISSSIIMAVIAGAVDRPWQLPMPGATTWSAVVGLAPRLTVTLAALPVRLSALPEVGAVNRVEDRRPSPFRSSLNVGSRSSSAKSWPVTAPVALVV